MLDQTPKEIAERKALRINPLKTCQPVGALYAALGVRRCMPHSHGSQGCVSYHRTFLTRHFKEPAVASSSSFTEGASVFGGGANLRSSVKNIFDLYDPDIIAVHTTCLSETIGDDLNAYILEMEIPDDKLVVHCNTPSYVGSHVTGHANMVAGFIKYLADKRAPKNDRIGVFPGFVNPGDIRELKRLLGLMGLPFIMLPDQTGVLDGPMTGVYEMYPDGGTTIDEIRALGGARMALALGEFASTEPALALKTKCGVDSKVMPLPFGVAMTDSFLMALSEISGNPVPRELEEERGRLVDLMLDANPYFYDRSCAIFGDPDTVLGLASLALELGLRPRFLVTGTPGEAFEKRGSALLGSHGALGGARVRAAGDLFELHQWIKNEPVDLLIGTSYGKQLAKAENVPFVRAGFPILDRYGHAYQPLIGYEGAIKLAIKIADAIMDRMDRDCADEDLELVM
ncbi:MAG: nitrogenase molybdenum-iron protein subunit beta [Deltaproteobacteria bacterium]|jgi:nitrogenase molybdenum-iron protein beta chain|nr:nitrogenase molybdenum-iron protein subunit beta [Deltaproteobacteria bacterium]